MTWYQPAFSIQDGHVRTVLSQKVWYQGHHDYRVARSRSVKPPKECQLLQAMKTSTILDIPTKVSCRHTSIPSVSLTFVLRLLHSGSFRGLEENDESTDRIISQQLYYCPSTYLIPWILDLGVLTRNVKLNALMDLAKAPTGNYFSPSWPGPSSDAFNPLGQLAALNVLNAGIATATKLYAHSPYMNRYLL